MSCHLSQHGPSAHYAKQDKLKTRTAGYNLHMESKKVKIVKKKKKVKWWLPGAWGEVDKIYSV